MDILSLLGKPLKDDVVIDILEDMEIDVTYDFDRLHEGQSDKYWATAHEIGIQFRFDAAQTLDTIFLYIVPDEGFAACAQKNSDVLVFATAAEVQAFGESHRLQIAKGRADFLGVISDWIRRILYSLRVSCRQSGTSHSYARCTLSRLTMRRSD